MVEEVGELELGDELPKGKLQESGGGEECEEDARMGALVGLLKQTLKVSSNSTCGTAEPEQRHYRTCR